MHETRRLTTENTEATEGIRSSRSQVNPVVVSDDSVVKVMLDCER